RPGVHELPARAEAPLDVNVIDPTHTAPFSWQKRHEEEPRAGGRHGTHLANIVVALLVGEPVHAAVVTEEREAAAYAVRAQPGHIAAKEAHVHSRCHRLFPGAPERALNKVDRDHVPALPGEQNRRVTGATTDIERLASAQLAGQRLEARRQH